MNQHGDNEDRDLAASENPLILAVDDDEAIRMLMEAALGGYGFRVQVVENGREAIDAFEKLNPHAILMDVNMPEMDGFTACKTIRSLPNGEHVPVLMMTGLEDVESIDRAFVAGATDFVSKPINWAVLKYRIKYMLRASAAFNDVILQQKQIQELAYYDHLTGLANRTMFRENLIREVKNCRKEELLAVLFMDLDRFKLVNDSLGHKAGDNLLRQVAERIKTSIRRTDGLGWLKEDAKQVMVSRQGGDEFTVLLPNLKAPDNAGLVAKRINEKLSRVFYIDDHEVFISSSIGISLFPLDGNDAESLIANADLAMYHAKAIGGSRFQFFEQALNIQAKKRLEFENDLRKAVIGDKITLFYQPQVSLLDGRIVGAEALSRWHNPRMGNVSPAEFIPAIEEMGLVVPFTDWVIREAGRRLLEWYDQGIEAIRIAVNISSKHFVEQEIPDKIIKMLNAHNLPSSCLEVELTESVMAAQGSQTLDILNRLKEIGLTISVDDFGTGYSSLSYLKTFPVDVVKIDRFFIKDILTGKKDESIVKAMISMAHSMDMKVVAEGIETRKQLALLHRMGCDYGQGFLFSPAVPRDEFYGMLKAKKRFLP
ncbi:MAG: two-component system response regulator [Thermodesulfobacteriota bacterium]